MAPRRRRPRSRRRHSRCRGLVVAYCCERACAVSPVKRRLQRLRTWRGRVWRAAQWARRRRAAAARVLRRVRRPRARARAASSHLRASGYQVRWRALPARRARVVGRHVMLSPRKRAGEDRAARARLEVDDCGVARGPCVVGRSVGGVSARHLTTASAFRARVFVTLGDSS